MKKILIPIFVMVLFSVNVFAEDVFELEFYIDKEDNVVLDKISLADGFATESDEGDYWLKVLDKDYNELSSTNFPVYFYASTGESIRDVYKIMYIPYNKDASVIVFLKNDETIFHKKVESFCNNDFECNENENHYTCPTDCLSGGKDNYCDALKDGKCDPDCALEADIDCLGEEELPVSGIAISIEGNTKYIIFGVGGAIVLAIILFFALRKKHPSKKVAKK